MKKASLLTIASNPNIQKHFTQSTFIEGVGECLLVSVLDKLSILDEYIVMLRPVNFSVIAEQFKAKLASSVVFSLKKDSTFN